MRMLKDIWHYRGVILSLAVREYKGRYAGSLLGQFWSVLPPVVMIGLYTLIFSSVMKAKIPGSDDTLSYGLFLCTGIISWNYFSEVLTRCNGIFVEYGNMVKKSRFPRIILPLVVLLSSGINFCIVAFLFLVFLLSSGHFNPEALISIFPLLVCQQLFAMGLGLFLGSVNVFYRDTTQLTGVVLQLWFWLTPIVYPLSLLPSWAEVPVRFLNPLTPFMHAYQQAVLTGASPSGGVFLAACFVALTALVSGLLTFNALSSEFADEL